MGVCSLALACLLVSFCGVAAAGLPARYAAMLANGQRLEGSKLRDWHDETASPALDGQPLLAPANPLRWLHDRTQPLAEPPAPYVEFTNGDRLPGVVVDYRTGQEQPFDPAPPHLIVRVTLAFEPPENRPVAEIRVAAQYVRRIVWQRREGARQEPGTAIYRDGSSLAFRSVRFHAGQVHLLVSDGDRRIDWSDLAELALPATDPWQSWFDQVAAVCPTASTRLVEIETSTGLIASASLARLAARFEGNSSDADRWVHGIQPAWSLDILWIPFREIAYYRTFAPHEVPLSRLVPRNVTRQPGLSGAEEVAINRSAAGSPLRNLRQEFGWGVAARGGTDISFDLPPCACALRASVCLDREAGRGGCIRPQIYVNEAAGKPLWQGPVLVGSESAVETGQLKLAGTPGGQERIVLRLDPVIRGRPRGADPLDIRDFGDWCDPLLELDVAYVRAELDRRLPEQIAAWKDWSAETEDGTAGNAGVEIAFHRNDELPGAFEPFLSVHQAKLTLRRELKVRPEDKWLVIAARRLSHAGHTPQVEVQIGDRTTTLSVPPYQANPQDVPPLAVRLDDVAHNATESLAIEIRQLPAEQAAAVHYRAITIVPQLPTHFRVIQNQQQAAGVAVPAANRLRLELPTPLRVRATPQWGEARLIRFALKKQGGARITVELEDDQPRERRARYEIGGSNAGSESGIALTGDSSANDWFVVTRDLHADFGNIDLKAIIVACEGGAAVLVGSIDLARTRADLELAPLAGQASRLP